MQSKWLTAILAPILGLVAASIGAQEVADDAQIDQVAISNISSLYGSQPTRAISCTSH